MKFGAYFGLALALVFSGAHAQSAVTPEEPDLGSEAHIEALIAKMTLEEKVGQLTQLSEFWDVTGPAPDGEDVQRKVDLIKSGQIGSMLNVIGVEKVRQIQDYAINDSRLGIPVVFAYDVIHGHRTMFPLPLAEAASWDLPLIEKSARIAAIEASAQGLNWTFAPMVDISRDARWGRVMEGAGEDPFLGSQIGVARVRGFQGNDLSADDTIASTLKHFAGYGFAESGKDYNAAEVGTVTLFNVILAPFKAGIEQASARVVMNGFNTLNGIPATGDHWLQRDVLKGDWGFEGLVVSDWGSAIEMIDHGFVADGRHAAKVALSAGSDMDMESLVFLDHLESLADDGEVSMQHVDDAVRRVLNLKADLGLFDDPYRYLNEDREAANLFTDEHLSASRTMAERSIVLLKNQGDVLPLNKGENIALIGALAADQDAPLGNWRAQAESDSAVSVVQGFEAAGVTFSYSKGADVEIGRANFATEVVVNMDDRSGFGEAIEAARAADKVVIVLGEPALMSGEGRSRAQLGLPGVQQDLLEAVQAVNPDTVLVVMSGRPLVLTWADENVPAIVQAWHLGHQSGHAIANVLTGEYNPSGKLPMTFPRSAGQVPIYYNYLRTGRPGPRKEVFWSHYVDESNAPLYPFGHGLSYTTFQYSDLRTTKRGENVEVRVRVKNAGKKMGEEVVQLYLHDKVASVSRPVRELKAFEKIKLSPGRSQQVTFTLGAEDLGFYGPDGQYRVEPGKFDVFVGGTSAATLQSEFSF